MKVIVNNNFNKKLIKYLSLIFKKLKIFFLNINWSCFWNVMWKISSVWWVISLIVLILSRLNLSNRINIVESKIDWYTAENTLLDYFTLIESWDCTWAYSLLSDDFKEKQKFEWYCNWLSDIIGFEWLKITELLEKNTAISKVFLVEFRLKKRWLIPIESKWGMYVRYLNWKWEINANSVVYEHEWSSTACDFCKFDFC